MYMYDSITNTVCLPILLSECTCTMADQGFISDVSWYNLLILVQILNTFNTIFQQMEGMPPNATKYSRLSF